MKALPTFDIENEIGAKFIAGVDEAGRGPLCGPVVAAAVIFIPRLADGLCQAELPGSVPLITDSKQMTRIRRAAAYDWIIQNCEVGVGQCSPMEIDELNILHASMLAMKRAIANLPRQPDFILVDGNRLPDGGCLPGEGRRIDKTIARAVVKGDGKSLSIAAASIVAKETRDRIMRGLAAEHPQYSWEKNAGYPTAAHLRAIREFGVNRHYRKTFGPVKEYLKGA